MFKIFTFKKRDTRKISAGRLLPDFNILKYLSLPLVVLICTILFTLILFPYTVSVQVLNLPKVGEVSSETIIAPFSYDIIRMPDELERERKKAESKVLLVMQYNTDIKDDVRKKFNNLRERINVVVKSKNVDSVKTIESLVQMNEFSISTIRAIIANPRLIGDALSFTEDLMAKGISEIPVVGSLDKLSRLRTEYNASFEQYLLYDHEYVTLRKGNSETTVRLSDLPVSEVALEDLIRKLRQSRRYADEPLNALFEMMSKYVKSNVQINNALTDSRREKASQGVMEVIGKVIKDSEIVRKHQVVTPDILSRLMSLQHALYKTGNNEEKRRIWANNTGRLLILFLPLCFIAFYLYNYEKNLITNGRKLVALASIIIIQMVIMRFGLFIASRLVLPSGELTTIVPEYLLPFTAGPMLTAILFNPYIAFLSLLFMSIYSGVILGFSHYFFMYCLLGGLVSIYTVRDIRYRLHFFKIIPKVLLISIIVITIWHFASFNFSFLTLLQNYSLALISVVISVFLSMALTPLFERIFDLTTNMTLIELSDMNHPILKRLSIEAAGTYNHSVLVGNLAESAAQKIGANALLARVASYYHDIGKIEKSDYFVENNLPVEKNRHTKLAPSMSALIICSHVKDGVELAIKHRLPGVIKDVIMQHHGTSTVSFFYEKALEQDPHKQVQEQDFMYSGPIPQSPETAIIMLADSVEAASRSLGTSSPKLLRELVKKIIRDKFLSSQLDQSDLTLKDLDLIVEGFMPVLQGIFHSRIEYPKGA